MLGRYSLPLDTVPTPVAPGLQSTDLSQHAAFPASSVIEQLSILDVCLATGNLGRAKKIFASIRHKYDQERRSSGQHGQTLRLADIVPASVHTAFLRSIFRQGLVHGSTESKGAKTRKRAYASEAWEWFGMLLNEEKIHGSLDDSAWAVMLKGLVATNLTHPPTRVSDPAAPHLQPISHLYSLIRAHHRSLERILQDPIFSHAGLAGLNDHPSLEVIGELANVLADQGETDALAQVEEIRHRMTEKVRYQETGTSSSPIAKTSESEEGDVHEEGEEGGTDVLADVASLQPAKRSEGEDVPFRLGSLLGNLDTITGQRQRTKDPYVRQELLEESAYDAARWQAMHDHDQLNKIGLGTDVRLKGNQLQGFMSEWLEKLVPHLQEELASVGKGPREARSMDDQDTKALLRLMDPRKLAFITVVETVRSIGRNATTEGIKATRAIILLGRTVEDEIGAEAWEIMYPELYEQAMERSSAYPVGPQRAIRQFMMEQGIAAGAARAAQIEGYGDEADDIMSLTDEEEKQRKLMARRRALPWTQKMRAKVGGLLIKCFLDVAEIERTETDAEGNRIRERQPALYQSYQYSRGTKTGVLKLNPVVSQRLDKDSMGTAVFPRYLPMLVPPKPWTKYNSGGYRIHSTEVMRTQDCAEQAQYMRAASEQGHLNQVYAALDVLGNTAWTINRPVFDIVSTVWNSGKALADIPVDNAASSIPEPKIPKYADAKDPKFREAYRVQLKEVRNARAKAHSQRCDLNYKLEIARAYLGESFYFPHNVDFRGRAYPIPPNLSHIGDDMSRGLLTFAEGRKLGPTGLRWLRIQIANTAGFDKASFTDREQFAVDKIDEIMDSADRPLEGRRWWLKADDPWQCLAACMELTAALRSADPAEFVSHLPVQQDGTCNGLQHYAALGGDQAGAEQVNLAKGDKPADVYTAVAKAVNKEIERDLLTGEAKNRRTAAILQGKVTRKVVKQTVMTTVYGVTFIGAKRQIQRQLRDRGDIPSSEQYFAASYLAEKVLSSIGDIFQGASAIQIWLSLCARLIGRSVKLQSGTSPEKQFREPMASVIWTTPMGLPVAQPYRKQKKSQISTALQSVFITDPNTPTPIDPRAQATAFPPNYIHSLDATHMMLTAIECKRRGLVFASVHDSYWTHACDVDEMAGALRDTFVDLHSRDLLGDLKRDFQARYAGFVVRKSLITEAAEKMNASARARASSPTSSSSSSSSSSSPAPAYTRVDLHDLTRGLGSASALPPLAVAAERQLMEEASRAAEKAGMDEDDMEADEGRSFAPDAEEDEQDEDEESESEMDIEAESGGDGQEQEEEVEEPKTKKKAKSKAGSKTKSMTKAPRMSKHGKIVMFELADLLPDVPPKGNFDLEKVRESPYFFS